MFKLLLLFKQFRKFLKYRKCDSGIEATQTRLRGEGKQKSSTAAADVVLCLSNLRMNMFR